MEDFYKCSICGCESNEYDDFKTSIDHVDEDEEMTCENCYDEMNE